MRKRQQALAVVLLLAVACASVGTGDQIVVRAEDVLSNSLSVYSTAMDWHFHNSTKESPQVYKALELFRVKFPIAWNALDQAKRAYQRDKRVGTAELTAALDAIAALLAAVPALIGPA